jgi:O-antigen ligase/tetratricopeptide (TPR) repeat protein
MDQPTAFWGRHAQSAATGATLPGALLRVVDAGLCGVIFIAPYFFGGRHDLGRLVFVSIVAVTAAAWFLRQAVLPAAGWTRTTAHGLLLLAAALVTLQIVPLPADWLATISPRTAQLLPLWTAGSGDAAQLGTWQTISLVPHETTKALAMLLSYGLLFLVVIGRVEDHTDVRRLLKWIGVAAAMMAAFGLAQYVTSDGEFFWFYEHPHRSATQSLAGPFINRNHFASFLVMGVAPLVCLIPLAARKQLPATRRPVPLDPRRLAATWSLAAATALVVLCILLSRSRGGAVALLISGAVVTTLYVRRGLADQRFIYGLIGLGVVVGGVLTLYGREHAFARLDDVAGGAFQTIDQGGIRQGLWAANVAAFRAGWLSGAGIGSHREVCPVYLSQYFTKEYTHAENGYLQIASEAGIGGIVLLATALVLVASWCIGAWRRTRDEHALGLLAATAAGLAASTVHSVVDFVWYIPACMSVIIILAACALRLSQLSYATDKRAACRPVLARGRWLEIATAAVLIGAWTVATYVGPGAAAVHWDRYLRASVAHSDAESTAQARLNEQMLRELEQVVQWEPQSARAHLKLAVKSVARFDLEQQQAENAISFTNVCDAIEASKFDSDEAMRAWLERAIGDNLRWLRRAADEARAAAALCPLQGEAYLYLARLAFLDGNNPDAERAYTNQALRVRPHNADVLFEIGREELAANHLDAALERWQRCFGDAGPHQLKIISLLAGRIPAAKLLDALQPDWPLLRNIWNAYRNSGRAEDLDALLAYSLEKTRSATNKNDSVPPAHVWYWQSQLFAEVGQTDHALVCLEHAYRHDTRQYSIRRALAGALHAAGRYSEAEPHYRWCLARRPADKNLTAALVAISKARLVERGAGIAAARPPSTKSGDASSTSNSSNVPR